MILRNSQRVGVSSPRPCAACRQNLPYTSVRIAHPAHCRTRLPEAEFGVPTRTSCSTPPDTCHGVPEERSRLLLRGQGCDGKEPPARPVSRHSDSQLLHDGISADQTASIFHFARPVSWSPKGTRQHTRNQAHWTWRRHQAWTSSADGMACSCLCRIDMQVSDEVVQCLRLWT